MYDPYRRPISSMRTHNSENARSEYHTQLAKMSFDEIFDLTAGVYFHFYNIIKVVAGFYIQQDEVGRFVQAMSNTLHAKRWRS